MITFDIVPTDDIYQQIFGIEEGGLTEQFEATGYEYTMIIGNMGSMYLIMLAIPAFAILVKFIVCCFPYVKICNLDKKLNGVLKGIFWNDVINYLDQGYMVLSLMAMINLTDLRLGFSATNGERYNSLLAIVLMIVIVSFPFVMAFLYYKKIEYSKPLPNYHPDMKPAHLQQLYGTQDVEYI